MSVLFPTVDPVTKLFPMPTLEALRGLGWTKGDPGVPGAPGAPGAPGDKGDPGEPGKDGTVTPEMITLRDESVAAKNTTVAARDVAVTAKEDAVAAKVAAQAVGATNDAIMAGVAADPASAFSKSIAESFTTGLGPARVQHKKDPHKIITTFQTGHGFTAGAADPTTSLNDTAMFDLGTQSVRLVSAGAGVVATLGNMTAAPTDFQGKSLRVRLRMTGLPNVTRFEIYAGTNGVADRYAWGVPNGPVGTLYRQEVNQAVNYSKEGEWVDLDLSFADAIVTGAPNRANITSWQIRVADDSVGKVTVNLQGLYSVPQSDFYSAGVVSFTWDDSVSSPMELAKARLDRYGFLSTFYAILDVIGSPGYLTLDQMKRLYAQGNDIAPHCTTLARHSSPNGILDTGEAGWDAEFRELKEWHTRHGFTRSVDHYATPQGKFSVSLLSTMRKYFASHRSTVYSALDTAHPGDVMRLHCIPLPGKGTAVDLAKCKAAVTRAAAGGAWVIFMGHKIVTGPSTHPLECTLADFEELCDHVAASGVQVRTVGQVLGKS